MKAYIFAAGTGRRLAKSGFAMPPKILLEFGGRTLLERHLDSLDEIGCDQVTVVIGYQRHEVEKAIDKLGASLNLRVRSVFNPYFNEGSVLSLASVVNEITEEDGEVLLMDGDVLYSPELLRRLWRTTHATTLLVDFRCDLTDKEVVQVPIRNCRPIDFQKTWTGVADTIGESVGLFKIHPRDFPLVSNAVQSRLFGLKRNDSYDDVLRVLAIAGRFDWVDITGLPWIEIDFPEDVLRAENEVMPAIENVPNVPGKVLSNAGTRAVF